MKNEIESNTAVSARVDIGQVLDQAPWGALQVRVAAMAAISLLLGGFASQLLGLAAPVLAIEWAVARAAFAPAFAVTFVGMMIGSVTAGYLGDRFGRKPALIASISVLALATLCVSLAGSVTALVVLRLVTGIGFGGAIPVAGTITSEYSPLRGRTMAVTLTVVCVPLGGALAGAVGAYVLPLFGWQALFVIGGVSALLSVFALALLMPESPRFLAQSAECRNDLIRLIGSMGCHLDETADIASPAAHADRPGYGAVLKHPHLRDTFALSLSFAFCTMAVYAAMSWLPSMLTAEGLSIGLASSGLAAYNFGGVVGPILCGILIARAGSRFTLLAAALGGVLTAFLLAGMPAATAPGFSLFTLALGVLGFFVNAVETLLYVLAAHVYPTRIRVSGVSFVAGVGRVGAILSSYIGAMLIRAGHATYYGFQSIGLAITFVGLALVANHIQRTRRQKIEAAKAAAQG